MENSTARYKASFEGTDHLTEGRNCLLAISIGKEYHEGAKLAATVELINRRGFAACTIGIGDTLQRHNTEGVSLGDRYMRAARSGREWLARNERVLKSIHAPVQVVHWDEYLAHPRYLPFQRDIESAYRLDAGYRDAIEATIDIFLDRLRGRDEPFDEIAAAARSRAYILEECPIIMPLWAEQGHDFILYPQRMSPAMAATRRLFVEPTRPDVARWLPIKFKRKSGVPAAEGSLQDAPVPEPVSGSLWGNA